MRLKRLELFGFKSFADRTVMDFGDTSLTGIVGPNGCGKSNVVDGVRWALGETRPTSMRGAGMTDVIFKGSSSRPALSVAEVTLVFDNAEGALAERGAEVAITRRLYRSGEGEYLIDGGKVRLKDVKDLLFDTGLGSRGYSVLEQGRIDAVLSANPQQRRAVFEEAAGISRYRQRRHEAELRLKRVEQDVVRLDDVMGELRTRVRSLKIQAGKAERYVEAKREWSLGRRRWFEHKLHALDRGLAALAPLLEELGGRLGALREERAVCEAEVRSREEERSRVVAELDRVSSALGRLVGEMRALDERKSQLALRITSWEASSREEAERARELAEQLAHHRAELTAMGGAATQLRSAAQAAVTHAATLTGRMRELSAEYRSVRSAAAEQNDAVLACLHERTAAQNRITHLGEAQAPAAARAQRSLERLEDADRVIAEVTREAQARRADAAEARAGLEGRRAARAAQAAVLEGEQATLDVLAAERAETDLARAGMAARVESLRDRERQLEELSGGTRKVLEAVQSGAGPCDPEGVRGVVADHILVDTRLARALDAVLGERAAQLVASDAHVARRLVDWARERQLGQVGVVVPPGLGAPPCPSPSDYALFARYGNGVEGRLCDLVTCAPELRPLARALLCDVVVVSDLDLALQLVGANPRWRFVTPAGEVVDVAGIAGGHREVTAGAVGRRAKAGELERAIERADRALERNAEASALTAARRAAAAEELARLDALQDAARATLAEAAGAAEVAEARHADQVAARDHLAGERVRAEEEVASLARGLVEARTALTAAQAAFDVENGQLEELERGRHELERRRDALAREENQAEVERTRVTSELAGLEERIAAEEKRVELDQAEIRRAEGRARNYLANAAQGLEESARIDGEAAELAEEKVALDALQGELRATERSGAARITEVRQSAEEVQRRLDEAAEEQGERRLEAQRLEMSRAELLARAGEELALDEHHLRDEFEPDEELAGEGAMQRLEQRVAELREQLDKLGPVNMDAVEELDEVGGRLAFLEGQAEDLAASRKALDETIKKIDSESRRLFQETFDEVRVNFQRIFRQLFGGGRADVVLEEGVDVLDAGIEIVARPPGREMLSIGLLSGGQRTMTALALLFAVFEARPSPFCVLDEVDAALDDANIDRFLGMLEGFRRDTQFIVVTHNKGTMSACEALFGVTMEVKGVSRFVAVELEQAMTYAPAASAADAAPEGAAEPSPGKRATSGRDAETGEPVVELRPAPRPADVEVELGVEDDAAALR
jgi:chromosome segregation protein